MRMQVGIAQEELRGKGAVKDRASEIMKFLDRATVEERAMPRYTTIALHYNTLHYTTGHDMT